MRPAIRFGKSARLLDGGTDRFPGTGFLRADIHTLFDLHLVTVVETSEDFVTRVSPHSFGAATGSAGASFHESRVSALVRAFRSILAVRRSPPRSRYVHRRSRRTARTRC